MTWQVILIMLNIVHIQRLSLVCFCEIIMVKSFVLVVTFNQVMKLEALYT